MQFRTRHDLPEKARQQLAELLNARLADAIDLKLQTKQAHWNVKGPHFIALHELFDKLADQVDGHADDLAERVVQLGGVAEGTSAAVANRTTLEPYPLQLADGMAHVEKLADAVAAFVKAIRQAIDVATQLGDAGTADLFTEIVRDMDKSLWFLEAHLHAAR